mmetsp:Transcript_78302/g.242772  ORF Transcript_78302/g.242772 Transcript_78302/m.242772 type:complete len:257 (+) Transcript_78302:404-1174(+)
MRGPGLCMLPRCHSRGAARLPRDGRPARRGGAAREECRRDVYRQRSLVPRVSSARAAAVPRRARVGGPPRRFCLRGASQAGRAGGRRAVRGLVLAGAVLRARLQQAVAAASGREVRPRPGAAPRSVCRGRGRRHQRVGGLAQARTADRPAPREPLPASHAEQGPGGRQGRARRGDAALCVGGGAPLADGRRRARVPALGEARLAPRRHGRGDSERVSRPGRAAGRQAGRQAARLFSGPAALRAARSPGEQGTGAPR